MWVTGVQTCALPILLWSDEVSVFIKFADSYMFLALVLIVPTHVKFVLDCVYGDPHHWQTKMIWDQISIFVLAKTTSV